jgi:hypothetical protein
MSALIDWMESNPVWIGKLVALSALIFVAGLVVVPIAVRSMPADYFMTHRPPLASLASKHPVLRISVLILQNLVGLVLLLAGILMVALPGPGILTILVSITLLTFPGKRALELRLVRIGPVLRSINWIRAKAGRGPLILPDQRC